MEAAVIASRDLASSLPEEPEIQEDSGASAKEDESSDTEEKVPSGKDDAPKRPTTDSSDEE